LNHSKVTQLKDWLKQQRVDEEYNLHLTPSNVLIFYNVKSREEQLECQWLQEMCTKLALSAQVVKDVTEVDIEEKIAEAQRGALSWLLVTIMSHGVKGLILDKNHRPIEINDIAT